MKVFFGVSLIIFGVLFGLWVGVWWAFIGGIVDVIEAVKATELSSIAVAIGVAKVIFAGFLGWLGGIIPVTVGFGLATS